MVPGAAGLAAGLAGATGAAEKVDLRPVLARVEVELPDGTKAWAERREGQSAWEAAEAFIEGLGDRSEEVAHVRAKLAGLLRAEDWEDVVASVVVNLPDGTRAWAERREGQSAWEAAEAFIEGLGVGYGDMGHNRDSLAWQLEAVDIRPVLGELWAGLPDGTKAWVMLREGQTAWEAAGVFLDGVRGRHVEVAYSRTSLAERLPPVSSRNALTTAGAAFLYCADARSPPVGLVLLAAAGSSEFDRMPGCLRDGVARVRLGPGSWILFNESEAEGSRTWTRRCPACAVECDYTLRDNEWARVGVGLYRLEAGLPCPETESAGVVDGVGYGRVSGGRRVVASVAVDLDWGPEARELVVYEGDSAELAVERFLDEVKTAHGRSSPGVFGLDYSAVDLISRLR